MITADVHGTTRTIVVALPDIQALREELARFDPILRVPLRKGAAAAVAPNQDRIMSEKDNIDRVNKLYEAFTRGDIDYILDQLTDDVRWVTHLDPVVPWAGTFPGKEAVPQFFQSIASHIEITAFTPKDFVAQADTVVSLGDVAYRSRTNGTTAVSNWVFIWKLREGRVYSYEQFHDGNLAAMFR